MYDQISDEVDVDIYSEDKRQALCIIFDVKQSSTLGELRRQAERDVKMFLPTLKYKFLNGTVPLPVESEDLITVASVIEKEEEKYKIYIQNEKCKEPENPEAEMMSEDDKYGDKEDDKTESPKLGLLAKLRSPDSCELKGIKIYSEEEIEEAVGKEKERRRFWNRTARALVKKIPNKKDLYERVHKEWRLHKAYESGENVKTDAGPSGRNLKLKKSTLEKNTMRVSKAKEKCAELDSELEELMKKRNRSRDDEEKIRQLKSSSRAADAELRKANNALRHAVRKAKKSETSV